MNWLSFINSIVIVQLEMFEKILHWQRRFCDKFNKHHFFRFAKVIFSIRLHFLQTKRKPNYFFFFNKHSLDSKKKIIPCWKKRGAEETETIANRSKNERLLILWKSLNRMNFRKFSHSKNWTEFVDTKMLSLIMHQKMIHFWKPNKPVSRHQIIFWLEPTREKNEKELMKQFICSFFGFGLFFFWCISAFCMNGNFSCRWNQSVYVSLSLYICYYYNNNFYFVIKCSSLL